MQATLDTTALRAPVDPSAVRSFRKQMITSGDRHWRPRLDWHSIVTALGLAFVLASVITPFVGGWPPPIWSAAVWLLIFGIVASICPLLVRSELGLKTWTDRLRCRRFASANGLTYLPRADTASYPGILFQAGRRREALHRVHSTTGPILDCGTQVFVTGFGKSREERRWQYVAMRLPAPLPHMLLDARANGSFLHGLPMSISISPGQQVSLGGEMDHHFDLFCPKDYEFDAYYIFTPDLMAHLIDRAHAFDVEIVDDWLFLYTRYQFSVSDPDTWTRVATIQDTIARLMRDRARSYRDHRTMDEASSTPQAPSPITDHAAGTNVQTQAPIEAPADPPPTIAPAGRRLRKSRNWVAIAAGVLFVVAWVFRDVITNFLRGLLG